MATWKGSCGNCGKKPGPIMLKCKNCGTLGCSICVGPAGGKSRCKTCRKSTEKLKV